ncbi:hypothetical protein XF_2393 [Xylella fastidiosa 9a5c]|uniref:Uncharacterized protein n=1 Tax=Xylella fastidiosa (strain 9a5c) TaxID=160492 RepID=Q9PAV2_XYLFA|nr:hypothetical protein XF_2393 [Xylella fastidiosa 9a5c]
MIADPLTNGPMYCIHWIIRMQYISYACFTEPYVIVPAPTIPLPLGIPISPRNH